ncbi:MAG: hypothetical protein ACRYGG_21075 [Janthinobacterium lividum]
MPRFWSRFTLAHWTGFTLAEWAGFKVDGPDVSYLVEARAMFVPEKMTATFVAVEAARVSAGGAQATGVV